jgi:hypothetical protein
MNVTASAIARVRYGSAVDRIRVETATVEILPLRFAHVRMTNVKSRSGHDDKM